jgi:hypothetical protein
MHAEEGFTPACHHYRPRPRFQQRRRWWPAWPAAPENADARRGCAPITVCDEQIYCHFFLLRIGLLSVIMLSLCFLVDWLRKIVDPVVENVSNEYRLGLAILRAGAGNATNIWG